MLTSLKNYIDHDEKLNIAIIFNQKSRSKVNKNKYQNIDTIYAIKDALMNYGHHVSLFEANGSLPEKLKYESIDIAFNMSSSLRGPTIGLSQIPDILNSNNIPFIGSDLTTISITDNRYTTKRLLWINGIKSSNSILIDDLCKKNLNIPLDFPILIKYNISTYDEPYFWCTKTTSNIKSIVKSTNSSKLDLFAEEMDNSTLCSVPLIGNNSDFLFLQPLTFKYEKIPFKFHNDIICRESAVTKKYYSPLEFSTKKTNDIIDVAKNIFNILECKDFAEISLSIKKDLSINYVDIDCMPSFTPDVDAFPISAQYSDITYDNLINELIKAGTKRLVTKAK